MGLLKDRVRKNRIIPENIEDPKDRMRMLAVTYYAKLGQVNAHYVQEIANFN